jgi:hypothetical protein
MEAMKAARETRKSADSRQLATDGDIVLGGITERVSNYLYNY